jgi:hypothetical protein
VLKALNARYIPPGNSVEGPTFILSSYDHDVGLSEIDFSRISFIKLEDGQLIAANSWRLIEAGHHLRGKLYFPPLTTTAAEQGTLIIDFIEDGGKKVFKWP